MPSTLPPPVLEGAVLLRIPATGTAWAASLPILPVGLVLTVALGHPDLLGAGGDADLPAGYRVVGVATGRRPIGHTVDIFVSAEARETHPAVWDRLVHRAERVFDLRLGPVQQVLAAELGLHTRAFPR